MKLLPRIFADSEDEEDRRIDLSPPGRLSQSVLDYKAFIADHSQWFSQAGPDMGNGWSLVAVQVPPPASCG